MSTGCLCCLRRLINGDSFIARTTRVNEKEHVNQISLDTQKMGTEVVIVKSGKRICGSGAALATAPITQTKAYFEIKIQQSGVWGVGLATERVDLNRVPMGMCDSSWVLNSDGIVRHKREEIWRLSQIPQEGDIIGLSFDHIELNFFLNGKLLHCPVTGIRASNIYPVVYVDDGAILDVNFVDFWHLPPPGYDRIMIEMSLL